VSRGGTWTLGTRNLKTGTWNPEPGTHPTQSFQILYFCVCNVNVKIRKVSPVVPLFVLSFENGEFL